MQTQQQIINNRNYLCPSCNETVLPEIPLERIQETKYALICKINVKGLCDVCPIGEQQNALFVCTGRCNACRSSKPGRIVQNDDHKKKCIDTNADISRDELDGGDTDDWDPDFDQNTIRHEEQLETWEDGMEHIESDAEVAAKSKVDEKWMPVDNDSFFDNAPKEEWPKTSKEYFQL